MKIPNIKYLIKYLNLNMKYKYWLIFSFAFILIVIFFISGYFKFELGKTGNMMKDSHKSLTVSNNSIKIQTNLHILYDILDKFDSEIRKRNFNSSVITLEKITITETAIKSNISAIKNEIKDEEGKKLFSDIEIKIYEMQNVMSDLRNRVKAGNYSSVLKYTNRLKGNLNEIILKINGLNIHSEEISNRFHLDNISRIAGTQKISSIIIIISVAILIFISFTLLSVFIRSLDRFKNAFIKGSSGDLNARYPSEQGSKDEFNLLGITFNDFIEKLKGVINEVAEAADSLGVSSEELTDSTTSFSDNSQSQAASSEEITATMEEVSAGISNISSNTQIQNDKLYEVLALMDDLSKMIKIMSDKITDTQKQSKEITEQAKAGSESLHLMSTSMTEITNSSEEVSEIIEIIKSISNKINLLSLNAGIEASRAGDAGRGFAVVAGEIKKLADQTASSIGNIASLIEKNNDQINNGMQNINDTISGISKIIKGVESIDDMMAVIFLEVEKQQAANRLVNDSLDELKARSDEIKYATEEQGVAVGEVMKSISSINEMIQAGASGSEDIAVNVEMLSSMADNLKDKISFFSV